MIHIKTKKQTLVPKALEHLDGLLRKEMDAHAKDEAAVLLLSTHARGRIFEHVGWGRETAENQVEQGGLMVGEVFWDASSGKTVALALDILFGPTEGSMQHLTFTIETWPALLARYQLLEENASAHWGIIGWYHTHPKHLRVYMSKTDKQTQSSFFGEWHFATVINPQQQILRSFYGRDACACSTLFIDKA